MTERHSSLLKREEEEKKLGLAPGYRGRQMKEIEKYVHRSHS